MSLYRILLTTCLLSACVPDLTPATLPSASPTPDTSVNECRNYIDRTAVDADREMTWDVSVANNPERCMKVKVGQTVTYRGNFTEHPLKGQNGDDENPFGLAFSLIVEAGVAGQERTPMVFNSAGTFGYTCSVHFEMMGAIQVVP